MKPRTNSPVTPKQMTPLKMKSAGYPSVGPFPASERCPECDLGDITAEGNRIYNAVALSEHHFVWSGRTERSAEATRTV